MTQEEPTALSVPPARPPSVTMPRKCALTGSPRSAGVSCRPCTPWQARMKLARTVVTAAVARSRTCSSYLRGPVPLRHARATG